MVMVGGVAQPGGGHGPVRVEGDPMGDGRVQESIVLLVGVFHREVIRTTLQILTIT